MGLIHIFQFEGAGHNENRGLGGDAIGDGARLMVVTGKGEDDIERGGTFVLLYVLSAFSSKKLFCPLHVILISFVYKHRVVI